ncbi:MAG TPA: PASTA domain-containing protein, partial [Bryobacteraceae bacterium]|nr:PASTA domain-containing protein [Bryobacteraceae bacterium]
ESDLASAPMSPTPEGALEPTELGQTAVLQAASYERASGPPAPNLVGKSMREVLSLTAAAGILVEPRGSGIARAQHPAAGVRLQSGEHIVVEFGR